MTVPCFVNNVRCSFMCVIYNNGVVDQITRCSSMRSIRIALHVFFTCTYTCTGTKGITLTQYSIITVTTCIWPLDSKSILMLIINVVLIGKQTNMFFLMNLSNPRVTRQTNTSSERKNFIDCEYGCCFPKVVRICVACISQGFGFLLWPVV